MEKTILITGSTDGIGRQTALELAARGHRVLIHGRNFQKGRKVSEEIRAKTGNQRIQLFIADLSSLNQVRRLARQIKDSSERLDVLINNAGVFMTERVLTEDGLEMTFAVNHLAHFLLTLLLLGLLKRSVPARVITVSSEAHRSGHIDFHNLQGERCFDGHAAYSLSKLANILFAYELAKRLQGSGITSNCLTPGAVNTKMLRAGWGNFGKSVEEGARTPVYLAISPEVENLSGYYFEDLRPVSTSLESLDEELRLKFWELSETLAGITWEEANSTLR